MKNVKFAVSALLSVILVPASVQCFGQAATLNDCQAIADRLARYACYDNWDAASGNVRQSIPASRNSSAQQADTTQFGTAQPVAPAGVATGSSPDTTVDTFGRDARVVEGEDGQSELIDSVAALEQLGPSLWLITLDGGQQWQQMLSKRYALQVGDEIRIYSTRWGSSFRLSSTRLGGYIQVVRVDSSPSGQAANLPAPRPEPREAGEERSLLGRIFDRDSDDQPAAEPQPATESSSSTTVEGFGRADTDARLIEGADGKSELIDTVAALDEAGPSLWLITLEGGQKWQQMLSKRYSLEVGDEVRIYPTRWGSAFRLSSSRSGGYIQVQRVD